MSVNYIFPVRRVCVWQGGDSRLIKRVIYSLKNGHMKSVYNKMATLLLAQKYFDDSCGREVVFIPAPSKFMEINHAKLLAESFAALTGYKVLDILREPQAEIRQKNLTKKQRLQKVYQLKKEVCVQDKAVVFVDDVITSGATAQAAHQALGGPLHFQVWVVAEKTLGDEL